MFSKSLLLTATAWLLYISSAFSQRDCSNGPIRKEIRDLTDTEWNALADGLTYLHQQGLNDRLAYIHNDSFSPIHDHIEFFPWHRKTIIEFENALRDYDSELSIPYWDASRDFYNPAGSSIFTPERLGGNGEPGTADRCVRDGLQANWIVQTNITHRGCFTRDFNGGQNSISPYYSPEFLAMIIQRATDLDGFRRLLEYTYHDLLHASIRGNMGSSFSPTDFIFFLHHANVDRLWALWQFTHPQAANDYIGIHGADNMTTTPNDLLTYWNTPVSQYLHMGSGEACYRYDEIGNYETPIGSGYEYDSLPMEYHPILTLPRNLLQKWFPLGLNTQWMKMVFPPMKRYPKKNWNVVDPQFATQNGQMPIPQRLPEELMAQLGRDLVAKHAAEALAAEFINDLNSVGYRSPYM